MPARSELDGVGGGGGGWREGDRGQWEQYRATVSEGDSPFVSGVNTE